MPEFVLDKLAMWGLDLAGLATLATLTVALVELVKKHIKIGGPPLLAVSLVGAFIWSAIFYLPVWTTVMVSTLLTAITASGAWQGVKTIVGKVGEDSKPLGAGDRRIDQ